MRMEALWISGTDENSSSSSLIRVLYNIDLLNQILLFLPVKSLLVSKSVSKHWSSLISSPYFIKNHYIRNKHSKPGFLFLKTLLSNANYDSVLLSERITINLSIIFESKDRKPLVLEHSCNGLFLCCEYGGGSSYYIYNLSTKHYRIIPPNPEFPSFSISLVFDPVKSLNYEVISIGKIDDAYRIAIYSSVTSSWKLCESSYCLPNFIHFYKLAGVFWDGSLNWINLKSNTSSSFNIDREVLITLPFSDEMRDRHIIYFGEWMGHMHLILSDPTLLHCWDIFEMEINYVGWKLKYRVKLDELANHYWIDGSYPDQGFHVMLVVDGDVDELKALIHLTDDRILSCDLKKKSFKEICNCPMDHFDISHVYTESLANV